MNLSIELLEKIFLETDDIFLLYKFKNLFTEYFIKKYISISKIECHIKNTIDNIKSNFSLLNFINECPNEFKKFSLDYYKSHSKFSSIGNHSSTKLQYYFIEQNENNSSPSSYFNNLKIPKYGRINYNLTKLRNLKLIDGSELLKEPIIIQDPIIDLDSLLNKRNDEYKEILEKAIEDKVKLDKTIKINKYKNENLDEYKIYSDSILLDL